LRGFIQPLKDLIQRLLGLLQSLREANQSLLDVWQSLKDVNQPSFTPFFPKNGLFAQNREPSRTKGSDAVCNIGGASVPTSRLVNSLAPPKMPPRRGWLAAP